MKIKRVTKPDEISIDFSDHRIQIDGKHLIIGASPHTSAMWMWLPTKDIDELIEALLMIKKELQHDE